MPFHHANDYITNIASAALYMYSFRLIFCAKRLKNLSKTATNYQQKNLFCTHPITVTVSPRLLLETSVHRWVLFRPFIVSAIVSSSFLTVSLFNAQSP